MEELLTTDQAAERLGVNSSRIRQLCRAEKLPGAKKVGRDWLVPPSAIAMYREQNPPGGRGWPAGKPRK